MLDVCSKSSEEMDMSTQLFIHTGPQVETLECMRIYLHDNETKAMVVPKGWVASQWSACWKFSMGFFVCVFQDEENGDIDWEPLERILGGFLGLFWLQTMTSGCI